MTATADIMSHLHRILKQLTDRKERLERGPLQIRAHENRVSELQAVQATAKQSTTKARMAADNKQLQLQTSEAKIADLQTKLNACSSNREYQALLEQIAADKMTNSVLEDEILDAMEKAESLQENVKQSDANLAAGITKTEQLKQSVSIEATAFKADIAKLKTELADAVQYLPDDVRVDYDRIVKTRKDDSMASVEGDICNGCYQQITPNMVSYLAMKQMVICKSCGRMLYPVDSD
jgi:predicted  nucleic acid-binding Zn-ribbon protein